MTLYRSTRWSLSTNTILPTVIWYKPTSLLLTSDFGNTLILYSGNEKGCLGGSSSGSESPTGIDLYGLTVKTTYHSSSSVFKLY